MHALYLISVWLHIDANSAETGRLRKQAVRIARINLFLALIAVALGTMLVRGLP